jgi:23S rRNA pseudouridine1911/1915/1917 synthase
MSAAMDAEWRGFNPRRPEQSEMLHRIRKSHQPILDMHSTTSHMALMEGLETTHSGILGPGRLDRALAEAIPSLSRARIQALLESEALLVEGHPVNDPASKKHQGRNFCLKVPAPLPDKAKAQNIALNIMHEDEYLIIVDKPAGLVVHPAAGHADGTLVNALLHHCRGKLSGIGGVQRPGIVHRIDRDTSGLLVVAKTDKAHEGLAKLFAAHDIERRYLAVVTGLPTPPAGTVRTQIGRSTTNRKKMAVLPEGKGKHAVTHFRTIRQFKDTALVECRLETGRTHQVRVHMAHLGHPLIGDATYNNRRKAFRFGPNQSYFNRQALHAVSLGFIHPVTGEKLGFESKLPDDIQQLLTSLSV